MTTVSHLSGEADDVVLTGLGLDDTIICHQVSQGVRGRELLPTSQVLTRPLLESGGGRVSEPPAAEALHPGKAIRVGRNTGATSV